MSDSTTDLDHPILKLTPQEKAAYAHLFKLADSDSLGVVTGERAVAFFEKTHVPAPALGEIWQIADTENRGLLTRPGFCMVLRLIGWWQNGQQQPSTELAFKPAPLPKFDGITLPGPAGSGAAQAASPTAGAFPPTALQPQLSGQSTGGGPIRVPPLDPAKVQQYSGLFEKSGAQNGLLDGGTAKSIFERAGLPNEVLGKIWMLSDREQRGALDQTEFIVAMHLLTSMKTRAMSALPNTLPPALYEAAARRGARPPSRQMSQPSGPPPGAVPRQFTPVSSVPRTQSPLAKPPGYGTPPPQSAQTTGQPWLVTQQEKAQYDKYFSTIDTSSKGVISGEQAVQFFSDSRLPEDTLASIWDLADINSQGQLNKEEFAVAMYLIKQQRSPNPPALPAFLPPTLIPPSMRGQQQSQQSTAPAFDAPPTTAPNAAQKSAAEDLFGLDEPQQSQQPSLQPQVTGASASRDPFGGSQASSPSSPTRFQPQPQQQGSSIFKPFMPTSAFGTSLQQQNTGGSVASSQGQQARGLPPQQQAPAAASRDMDDLLGDSDANAVESSKLNSETTELANMSNQIGNLRNQMEATQTKKTATQADLTAAANQKKDLEQRLQSFRTQYESEVKTVKDLEQQLTASRESTKKMSQDLAMLEGTHQDLQTQHTTIATQLRADQDENASLKQKISQVNADVSRLKPEIEKMKLDARQQKGLVSINKKQLATNESERERLQSEKEGLEREAASAAEVEKSRSVEPTPAVTGQASNVASPAPSTMSSTNPFFRKASAEGVRSPGPASPPAAASSGPTPSAFDALFGPSESFAPKGQTAGSRAATPPATSFIGRALPAAAAAGVGGAVLGAGGMAMADSMSSAGEPTPAATPPPHGEEREKDSPLEHASVSGQHEPPPPPENRQFAPTHLPMGGVGGVGYAESDAASSTQVVPPASRAGGVETPREMTSSPAPPVSSIPGAFEPTEETSGSVEREVVPGAFPPEDERRPGVEAAEVGEEEGEAPTKAKDAPTDFDSAFAGFGGGEKAKEAEAHQDAFAPSSSKQLDAPQASQAHPSQAQGTSSEFPPIQNLEHDDDEDDSDSDEEHERSGSGFDDSFTSAAEPQAKGKESHLPAGAVATAATAAVAAPVVFAASGHHENSDAAAGRPGLTSTQSAVSELPDIGKEKSPPTYEQSDSAAHGGSGERTTSNQFPPEFGDLLPAREDPTSPPPPATSPPPATEAESSSRPAFPDRQSSLRNISSSAGGSGSVSGAQPLATPSTDVFVDASSRPMSTWTDAPAGPESSSHAHTGSAGKNAFDDFDDFDDLSEAKEADKSGGSDFDFGFGRQSADEFNPAFDSPAASHTPTTRSVLPAGGQESNGFANFTPNVSHGDPFGGSSVGSGGNGSIQNTPQNVQHDWDAIFSGLDSGKGVDTSFAGAATGAASSDDPWTTSASTNGAGAATNGTTPAGLAMPSPSPAPASNVGGVGKSQPLPALGRAITPGTEHDDPILKRLTGMGYPREQALGALERYDYDINKAVDHLSSSN